MFVINRNIPDGKWKLTEESKEQLNPLDFDVFINPKIIAETDMHEYGFEECGSYPSRGMIRRPIGVQLRYIDEHGDDHEVSLLNHKARVVCHECDHLDGLNMFSNELTEQTAEID